jgi:UDP-GlcNAc:undecaprenyl-phosphate GlcNAc-1-phosphate transferase
MLSSVQPYALFVLATVVSAVISAYAVRKTIFITKKMKIYDVPDKIRKIHGDGIPSLGGIGIFTGYLIVAVFFWPQHHFFMPAILSSSVLLFFTGIYDDLVNMSPSKKLIAQLIASFITAHFADIRIDPLFAAFGIGSIPYWPSIILTMLGSTFFINVFNFIDGIDGLAGVLAILYLGILGCVFATTGHDAIAGITFALLGATGGLLYFNLAPAKIYMGDTGSMFLGFTIFNFSVLFLNWCSTSEINFATLPVHGSMQAVVLVIAMLFMPVYDGLRVFILRLSKGISPLRADRAHLHYYLLDAGFTHSQSVGIIMGTNVLVIILAYLMQDVHPLITLLSITALTSLVLFVIYLRRQRNLNKLKN